jgi:xanthine dehydrogenase accessory factor
MAVTAADTLGTVGGGHLEFESIRLAREAFAGGYLDKPVPFEHRFALGPSLGQCCGGVVVWSWCAVLTCVVVCCIVLW